jgi:hypothetical protein
VPDPADGDPTNGASASGDAEGLGGQVGQRLAELVTTTLDVGASVARSLAAATTTRELPQSAGAPLDDIVTFGAAAAGNLLSRAVDAVRVADRVTRTAAGAATGGAAGAARSSSPPAGSERPSVTAGSTLRVPLLVENTGPTPTTELAFESVGVAQLSGSGEGIASDQVAFSPPTLVIAQRDFEKLTVRVHTKPTTAPGHYAATISGGGGWFTTVIDFEVVAPSSNAASTGRTAGV